MEYASILNILKSKRFLAVLVALVIVIVGWTIYLNLAFRIVNSDPPLSQFASVAKFLQINFNKPLVTNGLNVTSDSKIINSYKVTGQSIIIYLAPLAEGNNYSINLQNVSDTKGHIINKVLNFTAENVNFNKLSQAQQQAILSSQTNKPQSPDFTNFQNKQDLLTYGVTNSQLSALEKAIATFSPKANSIVINPKTIKAAPYNSASTQNHGTITFSLTIDQNTYTAKLFNFFNLTSVQLFLYDTSNNQVFDSGVVNS